MRKNHVWVIEWQVGASWRPRHVPPPGEATKKQVNDHMRSLQALYPTIPYRLRKYEAVK